MAGWRVVLVNGLDIRARGLVDAKVKRGVTCHRIPKIREVSVNKGQNSTNARNRAFETINDCHVTFRMYMNKKDTKGPLCVKRSNNCRLNLPKRQFSRAMKETMRM